MVKISRIIESPYVRWLGLMLVFHTMSAAFVLLGWTPRGEVTEQATSLVAAYALLRALKNEADV